MLCSARGTMLKSAIGFLTASLLLAAYGCGSSGSDSNGTGGSGNAAGTGGSGNVSGTGGSGNVSGPGGSGNSSGSGGSAGASDAGDDAPPPADGPFACGTETCSATQFCIHPCCGGAAPACFSKPEGGTCPAGSHDGCNSGFGSECSNPSDCCEPDPCIPPPAFCADAPESGCMLQGHDCVLLCA